MKYIKILFAQSIIVIIGFLILVSSVNADGFIFDWEPFIVSADLAFKNPEDKTPVRKSFIDDMEKSIFKDSRSTFPLSTDQDNISTPKSESTSLIKNIKISFFQVDAFTTNNHETHAYSSNDDEQISKLINSMTSLIFENSKNKSLETIGKIIEPQINFYFEF